MFFLGLNLKNIFSLGLSESEKSAQVKFFRPDWMIAQESLDFSRLESPDRFQMQYFKGKTEENRQHISIVSPAAR